MFASANSGLVAALPSLTASTEGKSIAMPETSGQILARSSLALLPLMTRIFRGFGPLLIRWHCLLALHSSD